MTDIAEAPDEPATTAPRTPGRPPLPLLLAAGAMLLVLIVALLPAPYVIEEPGPAYDTLGTSRVDGRAVPLISVPGRRTWPTSGHLDLLTVSIVGTPSRPPSWLDLAAAWPDPARAVVPAEAVYPTGVTAEQARAAGASQMQDSQQAAVAAALDELGYPVTATLRVDGVSAGSAAAGRLRTGDVIRSFAGVTVRDGCSLQAAVQANGSRPAAVELGRGSGSRTVTITPRRDPRTGRSVAGLLVSGRWRFPFAVDLRIEAVGGPSAGMMFALGIIDELTPGSLTGGRHIAGTGTICGDGAVGPIGGIVQKMHAARAAGATVFLAPRANCDEVRGHVPAGLTVLSVSRLKDALQDLKTVAAGASTAPLRSCTAD